MTTKHISITLRLSRELHEKLLDEAYRRRKKHAPDASMQKIATRLLEDYFSQSKGHSPEDQG
jgi:hypothetical protein